MILDQLDRLWSQLIDVTSHLVIPDWGSLIALFPVFVVITIIGPAITLAVIAWFVYVVRRPRTSVAVADGPMPAMTADDGSAVYPVGLPYCSVDRLVFDSGATRCVVGGHRLTVICPMCGLGRDAGITTCGNCGLVLKVERRPHVLRPSGPPPGGAAIA